MYHSQTPDTHANSQWIPSIAYASQEGPVVQTVFARVQQVLPSLCLLLQPTCANMCVATRIQVCVGEDRFFFYGSGATVVETLSVGRLYIHII